MPHHLLLLGIGVIMLIESGVVPFDPSGPTLPGTSAAASHAPPDPAHAPDAARAADAANPEAAMKSAVDDVADSPAARAEAALRVLAPRVAKQSHPDALRLAFRSYYAYREAHPNRVKNPYFYYVDFGLGNREPRGYVFDMDELAVVDGPFTVSHGAGSGGEGVPTRFSNRPGSKATSLGLYLAQETYAFHGRASGKAYRSVGLRLQGLSGPYNDAARRRGIVVHGAPYVTPQRAGRSEGCPAMEQGRARKLLPMLANGGMVFHFSPNDANWLADAAKSAGLTLSRS